MTPHSATPTQRLTADDPEYSEVAAELAALRAELATATHTAEVWERQHRQAVDIIEQREAAIREFLLVQRLPENEKDRRLAEQAAAMREAQTQLRATTENWREECLFRADEILTTALKQATP